MADAAVNTALYVAACLVIPFVWGVLVHHVFQRIEEAAVRSRASRPAAPARTPGPERTSTMWDYQI
jgi:hypothetical protein